MRILTLGKKVLFLVDTEERLTQNLALIQKDGHITSNQRELRIVKLMKNLKRRELSYQAIIDNLNKKRIPTKNRKNWSKSTIRGILRNPIYDNLVPSRS